MEACPKTNKAAIKEEKVKSTHILLAANSGREIKSSLFAHESSSFPPSLTSKGKMHHGEKSEILDCIVPKDLEQDKPITTAAVLDGAVIVQMLRPRNSVTFEDYITNELWPYIRSWMENNDRVDIVWDIYSKYSLKTGTREKRGGGTRRRVTLHTKIPGNWAEFLRVDLNKQELFVEIEKTLSQWNFQRKNNFLTHS